MEKSETALQFMDQGYGCAQSVLSTFAPEYGLTEELALRIGTGFGSGMGRMCLVCGALTGAFMVIGLKYGKTVTDGNRYGSETETTYQLVKQVAAAFGEKNGSIYCRDLIGHDLSVPEERARAAELGLFKTTCRKCVVDAVELLEGIL